MDSTRKDRHRGAWALALPPALALALAVAMPTAVFATSLNFSMGECCIDEVGSSCCRDTGCSGNHFCATDADCAAKAGGNTTCAGESTDDWKVSGTFAYPGTFSSCDNVTPMLIGKGASQILVGLMKWATGTTLDGAPVTDCSLRIDIDSISDPDIRNLVCDWYSWGTCDATDWAENVGTTALNVPLASLSTGDQTLTLSNCGANVNTTAGGYTQLRCGISGGLPTGSNVVNIRSYGTTLNGLPPRLIVGATLPTATPSNTATSTPTNTPTNTPANTSTPTNTPLPTATPTPTSAPVIDRVDSVPESWWYDRAKCNGPTDQAINGVRTYVGVCDRTGGRIVDHVEAPGSVPSGIRVRVSAYKLAATAATGTLTVSCAAQCVRNNDPVSATFGTAQTASFDVSTFAQYDRMAAATTPITPAGTCDALATILVECTLSAAPTSPALYPLGPMTVEILG